MQGIQGTVHSLYQLMLYQCGMREKLGQNELSRIEEDTAAKKNVYF